MSLFTLIAFAFLCAALYYICPLRLRWILLLLVSYGYYAYCGLSALPYILTTTLSTWAGALLIGRVGEQSKAYLREHKAELDAAQKKAHKANARSRQRALFFAVLLLNFGILAVLKYMSPLLSWGASLAGKTAPALNLLLPLGISFYTFQSMGYLIDVYNGKYAPEKNPARFALFVSFFPQLIQGPIARFDQLAHQLYEPHRFDLGNIERGALLMLWGFFKKKVIADRALPLVEQVFGNQSQYGGAVIVVGVLFYSLQQYTDFSGGIDMVTGIAQLFGIELAPNFKRPYFSVSLGDFWRRWHISLGGWMRDYVFYPFALTKPMARMSKSLKKHIHPQVARALPAALGNVLVFLLVGIWHGAQMNYVLWGLYNGLILAFTSLVEPAYKKMNERLPRLTASKGFHVFRILRTFLVVNIGWYFDRCVRASDAFQMLHKTFFSFNSWQLFDGTLDNLGLAAKDYRILLIATLILFAVSLLQERGVKIRDGLFSMPLALRWVILYAFMFFVLATFGGSNVANAGLMYAVF